MFSFIKNKIKCLLKSGTQKTPGVKNTDYSIGFFQIENLINNKVAFLFFNLSESFTFKDKESAHIYQMAERVSQATVKDRLAKEDRSVPVVLICRNGFQSRRLTEQLREEGFINVFFLDGGIVSDRD